MQIPVLDVIAGTTLRLTWVNTGTTPSSLLMNLLDRDETVVGSVTRWTPAMGTTTRRCMSRHHIAGTLAVPSR